MAIAKGFQEADRRTPSVSSALSRGLRLLSVFAEAPVWMSNSDIARRTDLPAATVARLTKSLTNMGFLHYSASRRRFRLASGVVRLGYGARSETHVVESVRPHLQMVADRFGVHAALAVLDGTEALYLEVCHSSATLVTLRLEAGSRVLIAGAPVGHALLACLDQRQREFLLNDLEHRHGSEWGVLGLEVERGLAEIADTGYTVSLGRWHADVQCVAVPLKPSDQTGAMSLGCGVPRGHMTVPRLKELGGDLVKLAARLSGKEDGAASIR